MVLPLLKLGTLVVRTISKLLANKLKEQAGKHLKFRNFIIAIAQVAVGALIFEVQRNARSEARKEGASKQELEALKQRDEGLSKELEYLKEKYAELEKLAKERGLAGFFNFSFASPEPLKSSSASTSQPEPVESTFLPAPVESAALSHPRTMKTFTAAVKSVI